MTIRRARRAARTIAGLSSVLILSLCFFATAQTAHAATQIYYSVGQNTSDHKTGTPTVTISGTTATFSADQNATNMGIGDEINFGGSTVFITGRTSSSTWSVETATGTTPVATTTATVTSITHAFSSLQAAINGYQAGNATSTSFLNTSDLVAGNYVLNLPLYYDTGSDTRNLIIKGINTGPSNYIRIYTPTSTNETNYSQRHGTKYSATSGWNLTASVNGTVLVVQTPYVRFDGLQIDNTAAGAQGEVAFQAPITTDDSYVSDTIFEGTGDKIPLLYYQIGATTVQFHIWNNLFVGGNVGLKINQANFGASTVYDNTFYDNLTSIYGYPSCSFSHSTTYINNLFASTSYPFLNGTCAAVGSDYNSTASTSLGYQIYTGASHPHDVLNATYSFTDSANGDYSLASADTGAKDLGTSLPSTDTYFPFTSDIIGTTRPQGTAWDIGAFEWFSAPDTTPPGLSAGAPSGQIAQTTSTTLSVTTNESATCKYSTTAGTAYASMTNTFTTTGGTSHSTLITGLQNGHVYNYYIRCQDVALNADTSDYAVSFEVNQGSPGTVYAASCSVADTNAAMAYVNAGDTLSIPAGTCGGYSSSSGLAVSKAITVTGAGIGQTILQISSTTPGTYFSGAFMPVSAPATIENMTIETDTSTTANSGTAITFSSGSNGFRVTNLKYIAQTPTITGYFVGVNDGVNYGLIDHVDVTGGNGNDELIQVHGPTDSWQQPNSMGHSEAVYIEDSTFRTSGSTQSYVTDCNVDARCVVRKLTITGDIKLDGHGFASNGGRGVRQYEAYDNDWTSTDNTSWAAIEMRGGTGMIFNNTAATTQTLGAVFYMTDYGYTAIWPNFGSTISSISVGNPTTITTASPHGFFDQQSVQITSANSTPSVNGTYTVTVTGANTFTIPVNVTVAGTTGNASDYQTPYDYPVKDQIGVGEDPKVAGSEPFYVWGNIRGGVSWPRSLKSISAAAISLYNIQIGSTTATYNEESTVQPNKDFYSDTGFDTSTTTVGVTTGVYASIPAACTVGQGYWATDKGGNWDASNATSNDGSLYKCIATNTWSSYYTPYAYPHYLTAASTTDTDAVDIGGGARFFGTGKFYAVSTSTMTGAYATLGATTTPIAATTASSSADYWLDATISTWLKSGTYEKTWTETSNTLNATTTHHMVGDLQANTSYNVKVDGALATATVNGGSCSAGVCTSDASGKIYFDYTGGYSTHTFDVAPSGSATAPTLSTGAASSISATGATLNGSITANGGADATQSGFAYGTSSSLSTVIATSTLGSQTGTASFSSSISSLSCNTAYYFRSYATNTAGTGYGAIQTFTTSACAPTVTTQAASAIAPNGATGNGNITATGGANATVRGFVYGTTLSYGATTTQSGSFSTGAFTGAVSGLSCNTSYDIAAYATNSGGTSYGSNQSFTTSACGAPTVVTDAASAISQTGALVNAAISSTGGQDATQSGFAWGTGSALSGGDTATTTDGAQTGAASFSHSLASLSCGTTYYARAYATNPVATSYGSIVVLTTSACATAAPVVTSSAPGSGPSSFSAPLFAPGYGPKPSAAAQSAAAIVPISKALSSGETSSAVSSLQKVLNDNGFMVARSGPGSPGHETDSFGPLTKKAVEAFQKAYKIAGPGDPGYGNVGPKTRAILNALAAGNTVTIASPAAVAGAAPISSVASGLGLGSTGSSVTALQSFLNSHGFTIASSGPGSPGHETSTLGPLTVKAVQAFQEKYGIAKPGDLGYGYVGPKTKAKIDSLLKS